MNYIEIGHFCFVDEEWNADGKSGRSASGNDSGKLFPTLSTLLKRFC
jgi:hypothetical protein